VVYTLDFEAKEFSLGNSIVQALALVHQINTVIKNEIKIIMIIMISYSKHVPMAALNKCVRHSKKKQKKTHQLDVSPASLKPNPTTQRKTKCTCS
jgi:hypothetical protein